MKIHEQADELEKMIASADENISRNVAPLGENIPGLAMEPTFDLDFDQLRKECDGKARKMIKNATGFMLSDEMIKQNPYLKNKMQVDIISLSGMLYQLKVNETMQETLMEEVRSGAAHPRMFEVFGQLSKTIGELNKQLLQTVEAIKSTYKDAKFDIKEKEEDLKAIGPGQNGITRNAKGIIALGTKELINETKKLKAGIENKVEDAQIVKE
ncbi:MAG: hypothetical protein PHF86_00505 [Candidatus Nanoarchaeia archaeon]|nr:hypothetical protein [Candidatus Nanoarchaeia archaeon]